MVTMRDIAKRLGVSQATVSYALRGDPSVSEQTRKRVVEVAQELNYSPNISARNLKSGKSGAIGLVMQDLSNPYSIQLADSISRHALSRGLQTIVQQTFYEENENSILKHVASAFCDGVAFSPTRLDDEQVKAQLGGKPTVLISPFTPSHYFDTFDIPCKQGIFVATSYLLAKGCRNLLFMGMDYEPYEQIKDAVDTGKQRAAGFQMALMKNGITPTPNHFFNVNSWSPEVTRDAIRELWISGTHFDGVVCVNDATAIGLIRGLRDCGVQVPEDVQVIGFDGISDGEFISPSLTTIALDFDDMGHQIVEALCDQIDTAGSKRHDSADQHRSRRHMMGRFHLERRESTRQ